MNITRKNNLPIVISGLVLLTNFFITTANAQEVECLNSVEGEICRTEWIETLKTDSKLLQVRLTYFKKSDLYFIILGRMTLNKAWENKNNATLIINGSSYPIKSTDQDVRKAGEGVFEIRSFIFRKWYLEKIIEADSSKFLIGNDQFLISKEIKNYCRKLFERISRLNSTP